MKFIKGMIRSEFTMEILGSKNRRKEGAVIVHGQENKIELTMAEALILGTGKEVQGYEESQRDLCKSMCDLT